MKPMVEDPLNEIMILFHIYSSILCEKHLWDRYPGSMLPSPLIQNHSNKTRIPLYLFLHRSKKEHFKFPLSMRAIVSSLEMPQREMSWPFSLSYSTNQKEKKSSQSSCRQCGLLSSLP